MKKTDIEKTDKIINDLIELMDNTDKPPSVNVFVHALISTFTRWAILKAPTEKDAIDLVMSAVTLGIESARERIAKE